MRRLSRAGALWAVFVLSVAGAGCGSAEYPAEGARLLVASGFTDQVFVLATDDGRILDSISVDELLYSNDEPHGITVSPDGRRWYLTLAHGEPRLLVFERPGNRLIGSLAVPMGGASRIGITPDGITAFVPDYGRSAGDRPGEVARIRTSTLTITHQVRVCPAPHEARVDPTGELVLVTCAFGNEVVLLRAEDLTEVARAGPFAAPEGGRSMPMNAVWSGDGDRAWVTLMEADRVVEIDRAGQLTGGVDAGPRPVSIVRTPDDRRLLVTNRADRSLSIFRLPEFELERVVRLGDAPHPQGLATDGAGAVAYVGYEGEVGGRGGVVAVRIATGEILWRRPVGAYVLAVAWAPPIPSSDR